MNFKTIEENLLAVADRVKAANKGADFSCGQCEEIILDVKSICSEIYDDVASLREIEEGKLRFVGYTNGVQLLYAAKESNGGEGVFYSTTDQNCIIPLYMLKIHDHRIETTTEGEVCAVMLESIK
jgi:hypothetical protein